jgi:hypothetical protein
VSKQGARAGTCCAPASGPPPARSEVGRCGQVLGELLELEAGPGGIRGTGALLEFLQAEASLRGVLLEELDDPVPLTVRGANLLAHRTTTRRQASAASAPAPAVQAASTATAAAGTRVPLAAAWPTWMAP